MNVHKLFRKARRLKQIWACESCLLRMLNGFTVLILNAMWTKAWTLSFELAWDFIFFEFWILIWRSVNLSSSCGFYGLFRFMDAYVIFDSTIRKQELLYFHHFIGWKCLVYNPMQLINWICQSFYFMMWLVQTNWHMLIPCFLIHDQINIYYHNL